MKRVTLFAYALAGLNLVTSCNSKAPEATTEEAKAVPAVAHDSVASRFALDATASKLEWRGSEKAMSSHNGFIKLKEGVLMAENNVLTGGTVVIDMTSLEATDLEGGRKTKLEGHLKNGDFFNVGTHPTARFEITEVVPYGPERNQVVSIDTIFYGSNRPTHAITGNLTLRDSTKSITFPAYVSTNGDSLRAKAAFSIDRTKWGIHYRAAESFGDEMINKELELKLNLVGKRQ